MRAKIDAIDFYLPEQVLTNNQLAEQFPEWTVDKISAKTGIARRHIAGKGEFSSHLATAAGTKLFSDHKIDPQIVDYVILVTQSPDFYMPTTACIVQDQLGLRTDIGATDITLGCSGYVYALGLAKGLIESNQVKNVLILTADTYSKFINPGDKSVRTIFGDGASATLVVGVDEKESLYAFTYGTDGAGGKNLIVPHGGLRDASDIAPKAGTALRDLTPSDYDLFMDGPEIFNFTLDVVPRSVEAVLAKAELDLAEIDLFVFHQANRFMLDHLRKKLGVSVEKFFISIEESGNTVSSTIPIALTEAIRQGRLEPGMRIMLMGFGVGLSWGGLLVDW
jgi:3-oxoacyl-[acyl-carrier-protein] synthase-3